MEELLEIGKQINVLLIIFALTAFWRGCAGMKRGLVEEIRRLLSLVIALFVLSLGILLYTSIKESDVKNIVLSVLVMLITGFLAKLVNLMMKSLAAIAHLPIISLLNRVLGIAIGVAEAVVALWIVYVVVNSFDTGQFGVWIMEWTGKSEVLQKLQKLNQIAYWISAGL